MAQDLLGNVGHLVFGGLRVQKAVSLGALPGDEILGHVWLPRVPVQEKAQGPRAKVGGNDRPDAPAEPLVPQPPREESGR